MLCCADFSLKPPQRRYSKCLIATASSALNLQLLIALVSVSCLQASSIKKKDIVVCLQKQDDLCSHYRKWLTAVAECAKALTDSKAAVATAEAEVKVIPVVMVY